MIEEWERLYFVSMSRDQGSTVAIRDESSDFVFIYFKTIINYMIFCFYFKQIVGFSFKALLPLPLLAHPRLTPFHSESLMIFLIFNLCDKKYDGFLI